jgi:hypothetical protein
MISERYKRARQKVALLRRALQQFEPRKVEPRPFPLADRIVTAELPDVSPVSFEGPFDALAGCP